jgi:hypothetical protein
MPFPREPLNGLPLLVSQRLLLERPTEIDRLGNILI